MSLKSKVTHALTCNINFPICPQDKDSNGRHTNKNPGHVDEMLLQDPTHLIQGLGYQ